MTDRTTAAPEPYVGPQPFEWEDRHRFFGRDREARDLLSMVIVDPVVLLFARSGAGKSSLVNAGLLPLLRAEGFDALPPTRVYGLTHQALGLPTSANLYLGNLVAGLAAGDESPSEGAGADVVSFLAARRAAQSGGAATTPRIIIIDQFEELLLPSPMPEVDRLAVFRALLEALDEDRRLRVLLVMREEFLASLERYRHLLPDLLRARFHLEPLRAPAALDAVTKPLRDTPRSFEPGAAELLVEELARTMLVAPDGSSVEGVGEFVEPVQLQIVCQSLWRRLPRDVHRITATDVDRYADVTVALGAFYESCLDQAVATGTVDKVELRCWFAERLITPIGTRGTVVGGPHDVEGIPRAAVGALEAAHIIRRERRAGAVWYELTHDRLIEPIRRSNDQIETKIQAAAPHRADADQVAWYAGADHIIPGARDGLALCLSGRGYRALLFHTGAVWRLNEVGLLAKLERVASVSAGSILAVVMGQEWSDLQFDEDGVARAFERRVVHPLRSLADSTIDRRTLMVGSLSPHRAGATLAAAFRKHLFGTHTLQDLPDEQGPRFLINATNLQTGGLWRFSRPYMGEWRIGLIPNPTEQLAVVVAASAALHVVSSVNLDIDPSMLARERVGREHDAVPSDIPLSDGGIYDTLALETVWGRSARLLIADGAGTTTDATTRGTSTFISQLARVVGVYDEVSHGVRRRQVIESFRLGARTGTYWGFGTDIAAYGLADALPLSIESTLELNRLPSRYSALEPHVQEQLINWGYAVCDAAIRTHVDSSLAAPTDFPYPDASA